jgi:hypothetical protein
LSHLDTVDDQCYVVAYKQRRDEVVGMAKEDGKRTVGQCLSLLGKFEAQFARRYKGYLHARKEGGEEQYEDDLYYIGHG